MRVDQRGAAPSRPRPRAPSRTCRPARRSSGNPISTTRTAPARSAPGRSTTPALAAPNVTVRSPGRRRPRPRRWRRSRRRGCPPPPRAARPRSTPRSRRPTDPRARRGTPCRRRASTAMSARASSRSRSVGRDVDPGARLGEPARSSPRPGFGARPSVLHREHRDPHTPSREVTRRHESVAAVVALAADHDRAAPVRAAHQVDARRARPPARRAPSDGRGARRAPGWRGRARRPASGEAPASTLSLPHRDRERDRVRLLVGERDEDARDAEPRRGASRCRRARRWAPDGWRATLMSCQRLPR